MRQLAGKAPVVSFALVASALAVVAFLLAAFLRPATALALQPGYSLDRISTDLYVETDASIHVVERQIYTFTKPNEGLVWYVLEPEGRESVKISSVRAVPLDGEGKPTQDWARMQLVDSDPASQGRVPGDSCVAKLRGADVRPWYSYSISDGMLRCYFPAEAGTYLVETDYIVANRVVLYRDVADLEWRYAQSDMPVAAHDVNLRIALPVPANAQVEPNTTVRAWGHGPSDGTFTIGEDGSVTYHVDTVEAGQYAESHIVFPAHWIENASISSAQRHTAAHRADAIAEETDWLDASARASIWDNRVRALFAPLIIVAALIAIIVVARFGRETRSRRWLIRIAATLGVIAMAEQAFFAEPITTVLLLAGAAVVLAVALLLPIHEDFDASSELELLPGEGDLDEGGLDGDRPDSDGSDSGGPDSDESESLSEDSALDDEPAMAVSEKQ